MLNLITTGDGSNSLLNTELNETYHSTHGAIRESLHVFIKNGLQFWLGKNPASKVSILEVGFGTGLNALLALQASLQPEIEIRYKTIEAFPVAIDLVKQLNYSQQLNFDVAEKYFNALHIAEWNKAVDITPCFVIEKMDRKIQELTLPDQTLDVVFFDAFAPNKQPEMWAQPILEKIFCAMKGNSVFVTYCAKGQLKRDLKSVGFKVETLPGPPGKREMVRGLKLNL